MRVIHWLFAVSAALFISGIGFIIAGARTAQAAAPAEPEAPAITPVATVKQIMDGIVAPSATAVFDSVGTIVDATGIHEKAPSTDAEWASVGASAAALVESANLLVMGDRAVDQQDWVKMAKAMSEAGMLVLKATDAKDPMGVLAAGETLNESCDSCHQLYSRE
jgi:cytochrome c556